MTITVVRFFDRARDALIVARELEDTGIAREDISIIANNSEDWYHDNRIDERRIDERHRHEHDHDNNTAEGAGAGATLGGLLGGGAGVLAGLGMLAVPGIGPLVAAGWLATAVAGAATGAVAGGLVGGLVGALTESGVSKEDARAYAEGVRRGGALVMVRIPASRAEEAEAIMERRNAIEARRLRDYYDRHGWEGLDDDRYDESAIRAEREALRRYPPHTHS
jgi:hypothetical protein